jgi:predicted HicB family RNase H-like nuclease
MVRRNRKKQTVATLHVRVKPSIKAAAVRMAREDNRSLSRWLEWLIEAEAARVESRKVGGET